MPICRHSQLHAQSPPPSSIPSCPSPTLLPHVASPYGPCPTPPIGSFYSPSRYAQQPFKHLMPKDRETYVHAHAGHPAARHIPSYTHCRTPDSARSGGRGRSVRVGFVRGVYACAKGRQRLTVSHLTEWESAGQPVQPQYCSSPKELTIMGSLRVPAYTATSQHEDP